MTPPSLPFFDHQTGIENRIMKTKNLQLQRADRAIRFRQRFRQPGNLPTNASASSKPEIPLSRESVSGSSKRQKNLCLSHRNRFSFLKKTLPGAALLFLLTAFSPFPVHSGQLGFTTGLQVVRGSYFYSELSTVTIFTGGLYYRADRWNLFVTLPVIGQSTSGVGLLGGLAMPNGYSEGRHGGSGRMHTGSEAGSSIYQIGLGELLTTAEIRLTPPFSPHPAVFLTGQVKLPTASATPDYGTGELDWSAGLRFQHMQNENLIYLTLGYKNFGDPQGVTYKNPVVAGIGAGHVFSGGRFSLQAFYEAYSEILEGYQPPRYLALTAFVRTGENRFLSVGLQKGFSESSPDLALMLGLEMGF